MSNASARHAKALDSAYARLSSRDAVQRAEAMHDLIEVVRDIARDMVHALAREREEPLLLAENVAWVATTVQPELERLIETGATEGIRLAAALLLVTFANQRSVPTLLAAAEAEEPALAIPAVSGLCRLRVPEARQLFVDRIQRERDPSVVLALLSGLETFDIPIPPDVRERWTRPDAPELVRSFIEAAEKHR